MAGGSHYDEKGRRGGAAIDLRPIVEMEMEKYPHLPLWPLRQAGYSTSNDIHTHTDQKATQTGSSVTSDYPPATLTRRDWGHMNASVALSDV